MDIINPNTEVVPTVFFPAGQDACAFYRMFIPYINMEYSEFIIRYGHLDVREIAGFKVAVVQRLMSELNLLTVQRIKQFGLKLVYDLDDDIWNLPGYNPAKRQYDSFQDNFWKCAREADVLTVSTRGLLTAARTSFKLDKEILIVPNAIDFKLFRRKPLNKDDLIIIGWGGSNTHSEDLKNALDVFPELLKENPNLRIEFAGSVPPHEVSKHPQARHRLWVAIGEYANRYASWGWDIAIAPLEDNRFNRSKSNIKMLEAAALKIPCLVSDVAPYNEFCSLGGEELRWLLCSKASDWKTKIKELVNDPALRDYYGELMCTTAYKYYNAEKIVENWKYVMRRAMAC
jgi:glycosyltransferase involved in cell wall biosynthesis